MWDNRSVLRRTTEGYREFDRLLNPTKIAAYGSQVESK